MNIILTSLNSKYIHSNLAIRYLSGYVKDLIEINIPEFTINQNLDFIASEIHKKEPDIIGFSTYIWNFEETLRICEILKKVNPSIKILLGGPEVSYDSESIMKKHRFIDYIMYGEGENTFREFIDSKIQGQRVSNIDGLVYRDGDNIIKNRERQLIQDLNTIPSPYENIENEFENKIVYYESSRGCPFNCQFCLSSTIRGVRFFNIDRVKKDLYNLINGKVRQVKFIDRTFNANKRYAMEIMQFIMDQDPKNMNFHFEVTAHLVDEELLDFLSNAKEGLFQFEIGVQSTNEKTLQSIGRTTNIPKLKEVVNKIKSYKNIHQHLDLIAGLPYEDLESFKRSFNEVYELKPEKLQLGFLKLLKGSDLRLNSEKYGYKYIDTPPYEVLETNHISYSDIIVLKGIEDLIEKYYNGNYFEHTLEFIIKNYYKNSYEFYKDFLGYWNHKGYHKILHSRNKLYTILKQFSQHKKHPHLKVLSNLLNYDYILNNKNGNLKLLSNNKYIGLSRKNIHDILKDKRILEKYLSQYKNVPTKTLIKKVRIEGFEVDVLEIINREYKPSSEENDRYILFDYKYGQIIRCRAYDITEIVRELI